MTATMPGVAAVLEAGRGEGIAPSLSACVISGGRTVHASCHGEVALRQAQGGRALRQAQGGREEVRPVGPGDPFDVASLTKVLATTGLAAQLVAEGRLELDAPVASLLPAFGMGGKGAVTVRQLLAHTSGLPAWRRYFAAAARDPGARAAFLPPGERPDVDGLGPALAAGRSLVGAAACAEPLEADPGTRALYSDVGFIALGLALEAAGGAGLAELCEARLFRPLGLRSTFFLDGVRPAAARAGAAGRAFLPTGRSEPRHEVCRGTVHDDNAWAMGGVAGHAGLFSTAEEVAAVGQAWLDALSGRPSVVPAGAAREFARRDPTPGSDRALGWDTPGGAAPSIGDRLGRGPRGAIGHLGYTGCSLWIDLDAGLVCALLTNHTHPGGVAQGARIRQLRRRFHDAVAEAVGTAPGLTRR